jgi:hypothetical protein
MWTETHHYRFPSEELPEAPELSAIDIIGDGLVNARWWGEEPTAWAEYRIPAPEFPKRVFA